MRTPSSTSRTVSESGTPLPKLAHLPDPDPEGACSLRGRTSFGLPGVIEETSHCIATDGIRLVFEEMLGSGSFGSVYRARVEFTRHFQEAPLPAKVAVKVIDTRRISQMTGFPVPFVKPRLLREVEILQRLGAHPNVLKLYMTLLSEETDMLYMVTQLVNGADLFQTIVRRRRPFNEKTVKEIFAQMVDAVKFCHDQGVAHRDVKLENVLLEDGPQPTVVLCDYGQAKVLQAEGYTDTSQTLTTSPAYTAPEVSGAIQQGLPYDAFKADAFGLGVVLYRMLCNVSPDAGKDASYERHRRWSELSTHAKELIHKLLCADPSQRLAVKDIAKHPWLETSQRAESSSKSVPPSSHGYPVVVPSHMSGNTPQSTPAWARAELDALLALQRFVIAAQRERGTCCWALCDLNAEREYHWQSKATDERCAELSTLLESLTEGEQFGAKAQDHVHVWQELHTTIVESIKQLNETRTETRKILSDREDTLSEPEDDFWRAFRGYCGLIAEVIAGATQCLAALINSAARLQSCDLGYHLLLLSAEQLGRERAFLMGHLDRPETLRRSKVICEMCKIVGARQMLLGSSGGKEGKNNGAVVTSDIGLMPTLRLIDTAPLDHDELAALEEKEVRIIAPPRQGGSRAPAAAEVFHMLTGLVDKVHALAMVQLTEMFNMSGRAAFASNPAARGSGTSAFVGTQSPTIGTPSP